MTTHPTETTLNDLVDGLLDEESEGSLRAHLAECARCRSEVDELEALKHRASGMAGELTPDRDLWPEIEAGIRSSERPPATLPLTSTGRRRAVERDGSGRRRWRGGGRITSVLLRAAAVVALVGMSSGITYLLVSSGPDGAAPSSITAEGSPGESPAAPGSSFASLAVEEAYRPAIEELSAYVEAGREHLQPETIATLEESLAIIEKAIRESREAVEADPGNRAATRALTGMYEAKIHLLRQAASLTRGI